jgi:hypothetical protein
VECKSAKSSKQRGRAKNSYKVVTKSNRASETPGSPQNKTPGMPGVLFLPPAAEVMRANA